MKVKAVSALRSKRGLHRVKGAEPQVVGLTPLITTKRKANTMTTYILRDSKTVEPQKGADGMEPDDTGLQPETGIESGELRETDGGGGLKVRRQRLPAKKRFVPS